MPSKNSVKQFEPESMYHVYNRGNNKRQIFLDKQDYSVFLSFLKYALLSVEEFSAREQVDKDVISNAAQFNLRRLRLSKELELVSFCLLPNHFHLQLYQFSENAITRLMRSVMTGYVLYFNKRYDTSGSLFQGTYKAVKVNSEPYWQHLSRYIHLNAEDVGADFRYYDYSSYKYYAQLAKADWVNPEKGLCDLSLEDYEKYIVDWKQKKYKQKEENSLFADK